VRRGRRLGVPRTEARGVFASPSCAVNSAFDNTGCGSTSAASGSSKSSSSGGICWGVMK